MQTRHYLASLIALGTACGDPTPVTAPANVVASRDAPNVVLVTVDTLRADQLGCYGSDHGASPRIDAWAAQSIVFARAIATAPTTVPAHASILSSRYTREHSVGWRNGSTRLEGVGTLAEAFRDAGYATAAFVSNMVLRRRAGLDRGFEIYDDDLPAAERNRGRIKERVAEQTTERALAWLRGRAGLEEESRPYFLWVHYQDPHGPYTPPLEYRDAVVLTPEPDERALPVLDNNTGFLGIPAYQAIPNLSLPSQYRGRYASEVYYADHWIGELFAAVGVAPGSLGQPEERDTIALLTADHGESMGEGNFYFVHVYSPMPVLAHVPMILYAPDLGAGRRSFVVSHVDVLPTLLELAGLAVPDGVSGVALGSVVRDGTSLSDRVVFSDTGLQVGVYRGERVVHVLRAWGPWQDAELPELPGPPAWLTYTWQPGSRPTPIADDPEMKRLATPYVEHVVPLVRSEPLDAAEREGLRALGYLHD